MESGFGRWRGSDSRPSNEPSHTIESEVSVKTYWRTSFLALLSLLATVAYSAGGYRLLKRIPISGDGTWDYIGADSVNRRIYVSHGSQLEVLDADSGAIVGKILAPGVNPADPSTLQGQGVRGAAIAPELGRGFTSNGRDSSMTIFDLKTLKVLGVVKVGENPDGYLYDPASRRAFTFSNRTKAATAVDGAAGTVAGNIDLGGKPEAAATDGKGLVYVNIQDKNLVTKFDSRKLTVMASWPTAPCEEPTSMAIDAKNHRLFVGCRNKLLAVMNTENGKIITTLPIGGNTDAAAFDPALRLVFTSNGEGTVTVIQEESPDKYSVLDNVKTEPGARTMALDLKRHKLFLCLANRTPPPAPVAGQTAPPAQIIHDSFRVLVVGRE